MRAVVLNRSAFVGINAGTLLLVMLPVGLRAQVSIGWDFGTASGTLSPNTGTTSADLSVSDLSSFLAQTLSLNTTSSSAGYAGATGDFSVSFAAKAGSFSLPDSSAFVFTLTPVSGYQVTLTELTFGSRSTASGPSDLAVYTSSDNYGSAVFSTSLSASPPDGSWLLYETGSLSSVTGTSSAPLTVRLYGYGGSSTSSGNWRLDDLTVSYSLTASAVPEPSTYAVLAGLAVLGFAVYRRRRNAGQGPVKFLPPFPLSICRTVDHAYRPSLCLLP